MARPILMDPELLHATTYIGIRERGHGRELLLPAKQGVDALLQAPHAIAEVRVAAGPVPADELAHVGGDALW